MIARPKHRPSSAIVDSWSTAAYGAWSTYATSTAEYWAQAWARGATPLTLAADVAGWSRALANRERPQWAHEHTIVREWPIARLRDYSGPDADPAMVATVILPPQAGHDSSIVDYAPGQSQVVTARESGCARVLSLDWIGATQATKDTTIEDYMDLLVEVADLLGGRINLVGDCQGGWLATIFTALHPDKVHSLAIAGAPIDYHLGQPLIIEWLRTVAPSGDLATFRGVVKANDGLLPGRFLLDGFKALQPDQEFSRAVQLMNHLHDPKYRERHRVFENWFQWTQSLPGGFYLWILEHLFAENKLIRGELVVEGRVVDLAQISCPVFLLAGEADHITPPEQVWAMADHVSTPSHLIGRHASATGHLGLFMGHEALREHWPVIFEEMAALSTPVSEEDPDALTDAPVSRHPRHRWTSTEHLMESRALTGAIDDRLHSTHVHRRPTSGAQATRPAVSDAHAAEAAGPGRSVAEVKAEAPGVAPATKAAPVKKAAPVEKAAPAKPATKQTPRPAAKPSEGTTPSADA